MAGRNTNVDGNLFIPGDVVHIRQDEQTSKGKIHLGPGLRSYGDEILATKCGILRKRDSPLMYWIDTHQKRYTPSRGENVIGIVVGKTVESYKVDIGSSEHASLSKLAFQGATKKNSPNIQMGDIVYAKLLFASRDMEPELVCVNSYGESEGLGPLPAAGFMFTVPLHHVRKLLSPECKLLQELGKGIQFEIAIGMNGRIWVKAKTVNQTLAVVNAISLSEHMDRFEMKAMCGKIFDVLSGF